MSDYDCDFESIPKKRKIKEISILNGLVNGPVKHKKIKTPHAAKELNKILDRTITGRAVHVSKTFAIDSRNPTDCYAQYANDTRRKPGLHYNAKLIAHPKTKTAAIIAILDIYVDDEIYVDYGFSYWSQIPTVGEEDDEEN